jgi:hypothetical protein
MITPMPSAAPMRISPVLCSIALLSACASGPSVLKKTAAADLGCPSKQLELEQLDKSKGGSSWLVTGCGKTAQYTVLKKTVTRTTEVSAYTPPAPPAAPAPPAPPSPEQQAQMQAFMDQHNQRMAQSQAKRDEFFANNGQQPLPPQARPAPADAPAPAASPVSSSSSYSGHVCLNDAYYSCPDAESTMALGAYGSCKMKCMMGGSKCSSCAPGAGERCTRQAPRDPECRK